MRRVLLAGAAALGLAGCGGGPPADLFVVERSGSVPGAELRLRLTDDGGAYCNDLDRRELTSAQLIEARELRRELIGEEGEPGEDTAPADRGLRLPGTERTVFRFRVLTEDGTVTFADSSPGALPLLGRIMKLTRDVARERCGLRR